MPRLEAESRTILMVQTRLGSKVTDYDRDNFSWIECDNQADLDEALAYVKAWKKPSLIECLKKLGQ